MVAKPIEVTCYAIANFTSNFLESVRGCRASGTVWDGGGMVAYSSLDDYCVAH